MVIPNHQWPAPFNLYGNALLQNGLHVSDTNLTEFHEGKGTEIRIVRCRIKGTDIDPGSTFNLVA